MTFFNHQPIWLLHFYVTGHSFFSLAKKLNKKTEINQQLEAVYAGRDKANVINHFVSVLRVCDIDKKIYIYLFVFFLGFYR